MIEEMEQHDVNRVIREAEVPVAIDFWMDDCPPCNMMAPKLRAAAEAYGGRAAVYRVRVEEGDALLALSRPCRPSSSSATRHPSPAWRGSSTARSWRRRSSAPPLPDPPTTMN